VCSTDYAYENPGTYTAKLTFRSFTAPDAVPTPTTPGDTYVQGLPDPYTNTFTASVTVNVSGTPVTTTTTPGPRVNNQDC
jgi:hypothetical protein